LAVITDCGHLPHLEVPERFLEVVSPHLLAAGDAGVTRPPRADG
jgi:pimeloyl-ACP methyl ester carboxylesterase